MNTPYFRVLRTILGLSMVGGLILLACGIYLIVLTDMDAFGGQLIAGAALLIVTALAIGGHITNEEDRYLRRKARLRELSGDRWPNAFSRAQDEWNTHNWNTNDGIEPPAIGGRREP